MSNPSQPNNIDFTVDVSNLYREESITDLKTASIRRLVPVTKEGKDDPNRQPIFIGHTQLMSPDGPLPIQAKLSATNFDDAFKEFPDAMKQALAEVVEKIKNIQQQQQMQQQQAKQQEGSRIIVPGR